MSEAESSERIGRKPTIDDILALSGPATPHFALQLRGRIARLIDGLDPSDPVRRLGERELERLRQLAAAGEQRGTGSVETLPKMESLAPAAPAEE
ncbi:MAG: hypothetical protein J7513_18235 [Solirubrobacteraceae bacterium]|nr:hypothetical protein [Solirubrobacteraceae bacterium]